MEWKTVKLGDCLSKIIDNRGKTPKDLAVSGHPLLEINAVSKNNKYPLYGEAKKYVDDVVYSTWFRSGHPQYGDILVPTVGTLGAVAYVDRNDCCIAQNLIALRANADICDSAYIYYLLCNPQIVKRLLNLDIGAVQASIKVPHLLALEILLPSLETQRRIATILSSLDDKIENNNRVNRNLEKQAQALFKSWFVDFEPWGGTMPEDWKEGTLGEICKQLKERVGERDDVKVLSPVTTGKLMLSEEYFTKQVFSQSIAKYIIVPPTSFAYNPARVNIGSLGMNEYDLDGCVSPVYVVFECLDGYEYYFDLFRQTNMFKKEVKLRAIGGVRQSLNYEDFARITCNIPSKDAIEKFNTIYLANLNVRNHNSKENDRLAALRDTLLPKLMKGEIEL